MAGEPNLCLERATAYDMPQASRLVTAPWTWRHDVLADLPDQELPSDSDAQNRLAAILNVAPASVIGIYACDTASPLVSLVGGAPNLVAAGGPLVQRAANGLLYRGRRTGKLGVETLSGTNERLADAGAAFMDVADGTVRSFLLVGRFNPNSGALNLRVIAKEDGVAPWCLTGSSGVPDVRLFGTAGYVQSAQVVGNFQDGGWHCIIGVLDSRVAGSHQLRLYTDLGNAASALFAATLANAGSFMIGSTGVFGNAAGFQTAYLACCDVALGAAELSRFWTHGARPAPLTTYTRANTVRTACAASAVSAWSANQYATRYAATFAARRNWRLEGVANDGPVTFQPIGSTDLYGTSAISGAAVKTSVDGVSGMRDGVRCTTSAGWPAAGSYLFVPGGGVAVVGASNVPWRGDTYYRRATLGTSGRLGLYIAGDPAGAEFFNLVADAAAPTQWTRGGGTCTPVNAAHNTVYLFAGCTNNNEDCDFADALLIKNCSVAPDWWVLTGVAAAVAQNPAAIMVSNAADAVLDHAQGSLRIRTAGYSGQGLPAWCTLPCYFDCNGPGGPANGEITLFYSAATTLRVRLSDAAGVTVAWWDVTGASYADANDHLLQLDWCAAAPVAYVAGVPWYAAFYFDGVLCTAAAIVAPTNPWVPDVGGTIYIGQQNPGHGTFSSRAAIEEVVIYPTPQRLLGTAPVVV